MKTILCFGDSNTWGYVSETGGRFPYEDRWTSILQKGLGERFTVIPEGLNGRTTVFTDPFVPYRNGIAAFPMLMDSHHPVDLLVVMLGTNDTKLVFKKEVSTITRGLRSVIEAALGRGYGPGGGNPKVLIISPARIIPGDPNNPIFDVRETREGVEKSAQFAREFEAVALRMGCYFLDAAPIAEVSPADGIHFTRKGHRDFGEWLVREIPKLQF